MTNLYGRFCRPGLVPLLQAIGLDVTYERASGDYLWRRQDDRLIPVLDLVGGYGANLFGHNHPDVIAAARDLFDRQLPVLAQGSCRRGAARLAEELCRRLGDYVVTFTNSGTETTEAAAKHCLLERPRRTFWAVKGAFHGKTLGAIQLTWSYRDAYPMCGPSVEFLDPMDPESWADALSRVSDVSAAFVEPIAGEGGIRPLPAAFVAWLANVCREHDIPLVADEIQSGMGRTGTFLAGEAMGLQPDYICLGKALGGGLAKIGALLVKRERYVEEFSLTHTSTFAEDDFSCGVALEALRILDRDDLLARCRSRGEYLIARLQELQRRFPKQIKDVRGVGLMVGLELHDYPHGRSRTLRMLSEQKRLGYLAASYLLNSHDVRVAPTLSEPLTLRLEPSAYVKEQELDTFVEAAALLCRALNAGDLAHLTRFQIGLPAGPVADQGQRQPRYRQERPRTTRRVAFLGHLLLDHHLTVCEPSLTSFSGQELEQYLDKGARIMTPTVFDQWNVRSRTGDDVHLSFIGLGLTSRQIVRAMQDRDLQWILRRIEDAVALAQNEGCQVMGFGGYTSIVTANCLRVSTKGIAVTSGNSLTVAMGLEAIHEAARQKGLHLPDVRFAVIGATGNIAGTYALMMAPKVRELLLVVRDVKSPKLKNLIEAINRIRPRIAYRITDTVEDIADCSVIVTASNTPEAIIYPRHLADGPVVICDISLPSDVAEDVASERPDAFVIRGGVVKLPYNDDLTIGGIPLERGHVFACMAETLLMGLEGLDAGSVGTVKPEEVLKARRMADKHGFALADIGGNEPSLASMSVAHPAAVARRVTRVGVRSRDRAAGGIRALPNS